jgi:hypothetical protein
MNSKHNQLPLIAGLAALLLAPLAALYAAEATYPSDAIMPLDRVAGERTTISLNGTWQIDESVSATEVPKTFSRTLVVPGLVSLAKPEFPEVGTVSAKRNYFWYQKSFAAPARREAAILRIGKSQFGTAVWLNGKPVGEHLSCWTAGYFNLTEGMNWSGENQLVVRIGAHPALLPANIPGAGIAGSSKYWIPGIWDDVGLILRDNPVIETIQVAPRVNASEAVVQTKVKNYGPALSFELSHVVKSWKAGTVVARGEPQNVQIEAGEEKTFTQTIKIPNARLWSPDDPFLYVVESRTTGDSIQTRFGMREYTFDNAARRGLLNGKPYFLRGGNIEWNLHVEDPLCGDRAWDRAWVKKVVADIPKKLNWNTFRFTIGTTPDMWLDIADEEGILIQLEPRIWGYRAEWDKQELIAEFGRWMRDNWNHPCVFMWDANNEADKGRELVPVINAVRPLDLSGRAWENGWGPPASPTDPCEAHPYFLNQEQWQDLRKLTTLNPEDSWEGWSKNPKGWARSPEGEGHCLIINEYCWLWLYSDGRPVPLSADIYDKALPGGKAGERQEYRWYMTAVLTEFWRFQRCAIGVLYYDFLGSYPLGRPGPGPYHFGAFSDIVTLQLQPEFEKYMTEAFKPLGVYIKFWGDGEPGKQPYVPYGQWFPVQGGANHHFAVGMINDDLEPVTGKLVLSVENLEGKTIVSTEKPFRLDGVGKNTYELAVSVPKESGKYLLKAVAYPQGIRHKSPTVSLRKVVVDSP